LSQIIALCGGIDAAAERLCSGIYAGIGKRPVREQIGRWPAAIRDSHITSDCGSAHSISALELALIFSVIRGTMRMSFQKLR
jgi:hypothetical protein